MSVYKQDDWCERLLRSDTSHAAKVSIEPHRGRLQQMVLETFRLHRTLGLTDDQIEAICNLPHQTASARRRELVLAGLVYDSGERRKTRTGRSAAVWRLR